MQERAREQEKTDNTNKSRQRGEEGKIKKDTIQARTQSKEETNT